jgi:hypothetical protein
MAKTNGKLSSTRIDRLVSLYVRVRDARDKLKEEYKTALAPFEHEMGELSGLMLKFLDDTGQESAKTAQGTVYASVRHTASLFDPDAFIEFVRENDLYELMDRKANAPACRDFALEKGALPPGVKINSQRIVGVRSGS